MIYVGYQGIGKSSIAGKNNCIDLESGNFWVNDTRNENWYKEYVNIAQHLSNQGYKVFMSSHKIVREELNNRGINFIVICPSLTLKEQWVKRLQERFDRTRSTKDFKALKNAEEMYEENIKDLTSEKNTIVITTIDYDLLDILRGEDNENT
jgi:SRSO17 transposase